MNFCPECDAPVTDRKCKKCGWGKVEKRENQGLPLWVSPPPYTKPDDDTVCGEWLEDGSLCQKTIRQHIEEFRAFGERIARRVVRL